MQLRISAALAVFCAGVTIPIVKGQTAQNFVAVTPCRVADTRLADGPLGGPIMEASETRSFPVPASTCNIPAGATAYSLNVTVVVPNLYLAYLTIWPTGQPQPFVSTLNSSVSVIANAAIVPAGTNGAISVYVTNQTHVIMDIDGYFVTVSSGTNVALGSGALVSNTSAGDNTAIGSGSLMNNIAATASGNTAVGANTLSNNISGNNNTAIGNDSLTKNISGGNTAVGSGSLASNTDGGGNTAMGANSLTSNGVGGGNTAMGANSLPSNVNGQENSAFGLNALESNVTGGDNTAMGFGALSNNVVGGSNTSIGSFALQQVTGNSNIGLGAYAGGQLVGGASNIDIGNQGTSTDSGIIRIGDSNQTSTYISGIIGANPGSGNYVLITSSGQLYSPNSSQRYKDDIRSMGEASDALMNLRPVTFRYKQPAEDGSKPLEYGLIAEEVAKIYPELVVYGKDGQIESVQYYQLPTLLLNEVQKEHKVIQEKTEQIQALELRVAALEQLIRGRVEQTASVH